jgi:hypothetical protein
VGRQPGRLHLGSQLTPPGNFKIKNSEIEDLCVDTSFRWQQR